MTKDDIIRNLHIPPGARVLEVGSGDNPLPRSDVLSDKNTGFTKDREGRPLHRDKRPFVCCSVEQLPFEDKSFDYIIARQMLEYVDDPRKAIKELTRVGKAGYIEVANGLRELLYDWEDRNWVALVRDEKLYFRRKEGRSPFANLFRNIRDPYLVDFIYRNWELFNYTLEWKNDIPFEVDENPIDPVTLAAKLDIDFTRFKTKLSFSEKIKDLGRAMKGLIA